MLTVAATRRGRNGTIGHATANEPEAPMALFRLDQQQPQVHADAYVADNATVIGRVVLDARASVWFNAVLRGDNEVIHIGAGSNVQDGAVLHTDPGFPMHIAEGVSIGHQAMLHGCTVGAGSLIGIQAIVMNGAVIGRDCLVGAGAMVTEGKHFPDRSLILGAPAKVVRALTDDDLAGLRRAAESYSTRIVQYRDKLVRAR
jgi:carbonic anhydrase/acetyltransferase-like protein (isoleucine patch superfamily)